MKKKLLTVILVTTLASMILAGCGNTGSNVKEPATTQEATPTTEATPTEKTEETTDSVVTDIPEESTDPVVTDIPEDTTEETTAIESADRAMTVTDIFTELDKLYPIDDSSDRDRIDSSVIDRTHVVEYDDTAISLIFNSTVTDITSIDIEDGVVNGITFDGETITFIDYFNKLIETVGDPCSYNARDGYRRYNWLFTDGIDGTERTTYFIEIKVYGEAGSGYISF